MNQAIIAVCMVCYRYHTGYTCVLRTTHMYAKNFIFACYTSATRVLHVYRVLEGQTHGSVNVPYEHIYVMYVCVPHT